MLGTVRSCNYTKSLTDTTLRGNVTCFAPGRLFCTACCHFWVIAGGRRVLVLDDAEKACIRAVRSSRYRHNLGSSNLDGELLQILVILYVCGNGVAYRSSALLTVLLRPLEEQLLVALFSLLLMFVSTRISWISNFLT